MSQSFLCQLPNCNLNRELEVRRLAYERYRGLKHTLVDWSIKYCQFVKCRHYHDYQSSLDFWNSLLDNLMTSVWTPWCRVRARHGVRIVGAESKNSSAWRIGLDLSHKLHGAVVTVIKHGSDSTSSSDKLVLCSFIRCLFLINWHIAVLHSP